MGSPLYFPKEVSLSPLEQRYVASCHCPIEYPHYETARDWKTRLIETSKRDETITVNSAEILLPFPTLAYLITTAGLGIDTTIQEYFEGLDEQSHNFRLYKFMKDTLRNPNIPRSLLRSILYHANNCSVKLAKNDGSKVWSIHGVITEPLDDLFGVTPSTEYVLTHGRNNDGLIITREAHESDVDRLRRLPELWKNIIENLNI